MEHEYPTLDLQCLNDRKPSCNLPLEVSARDVLSGILALGLLLGWGFDRWRTAKAQADISAALSAAKVAAERARDQEMLLNEALRAEREALTTQLRAEEETVAKLRREIAALEADARPMQGVRYAAGRER